MGETCANEAGHVVGSHIEVMRLPCVGVGAGRTLIARTEGVKEFVERHLELAVPVVRIRAQAQRAEVDAPKRRSIVLIALAGQGKRDRSARRCATAA